MQPILSACFLLAYASVRGHNKNNQNPDMGFIRKKLGTKVAKRLVTMTKNDAFSNPEKRLL